MLCPERRRRYIIRDVFFSFFPPFYNCIVPLGFLPWEIRVAFPGASQLSRVALLNLQCMMGVLVLSSAAPNRPVRKRDDFVSSLFRLDRDGYLFLKKCRAWLQGTYKRRRSHVRVCYRQQERGGEGSRGRGWRS